MLFRLFRDGVEISDGSHGKDQQIHDGFRDVKHKQLILGMKQ